MDTCSYVRVSTRDQNEARQLIAMPVSTFYYKALQLKIPITYK